MSSKWETYKKLYQIAVEEKDCSWILYEDMKFFESYLITGHPSASQTVEPEDKLDSINKPRDNKKRLHSSESELEYHVSSCSSTDGKNKKIKKPQKRTQTRKFLDKNTTLPIQTVIE